MFAIIKFALLSIMGVITLTGAIRSYYYLDFEGGGLTWLLYFLLVLVFFVISVISIFISLKMIKRQDEEKLRKSARLVKLGSIFFFIAAYLYYKFKIRGFWEEDILVYLISVYIMLLGTSVFSFAFIRLLYKEKKLCVVKTIIFSILQLIFGVDQIRGIANRACRTLPCRKLRAIAKNGRRKLPAGKAQARTALRSTENSLTVPENR